MKRENCLKKAIARMEELNIQKNLIASIPLLTPVTIFYKSPIKSKNWEWTDVRLVCEIFDFNSLSLRATMIAVEDSEAYPFDNDLFRRSQNKEVMNNYALTFKRIEKWELYNHQDLPLLLGWPNQYPRLAELLKVRPPKRSLSELGADIAKLPKAPWTVVGLENS